MSRGPGKIERAVTDLLLGNPAGTFTVEDFAAVAYPGINRIEKKHRVAVLRSIKNIKNPPGTWWGSKSATYVKGAPCVLFNRLNLRSLGVANARTEWFVYSSLSDAEAETRALRPSSKTWPYILEGGPYAVLVDYYRALVAKDEDRSTALWAEYEALIKAVIFSRKTITGNVHPDFLRDCVTTDKQRGNT